MIDNGFATSLFNQIDSSKVLPPKQIASKLCAYCTNIWDKNFFVNSTVSELEITAQECGLCSVFYQLALRLGKKRRENIQIFRKRSSFVVNLHEPPVLSIVVGPGRTTAPTDIRRGFPRLPQPGGRTQMKLLREWLRNCNNDSTHECGPKGGSRLPTRLLDVGDEITPNILRLDCSEERISKNYVALSHRWGDVNVHPPFCTYRSNVDRFRERIHFDELPQTFKDAVTITRAIGIRYLWIDSLCIIQRDDDDWRKESARMEEVFSGAYCTIVASRAAGTHAGILGPHPRERQCTALQKGSEPPFYVCDAIDDFRNDVELGHLNKRGWVFQEKALSRRSIYFTENQLYWECGHGIRCETLSKLYNLKSSFLSDPDFPQSAERYYRGMKIRFFETLYEQYSKLDFTRPTDRSVGMAGLEKRLTRVYKTAGEFAVLDSFLHRSLLWQNPTGQPMTKIAYEQDRKVPSWSWMAVEGPIKYMDIPFDGVNWSKETDIQSPFEAFTNADSATTNYHAPDKGIRATARDFSFVPGQDTGELIWDRPGEDYDSLPKCVIVATQKMESLSEMQKMYVLLVMPLARNKNEGRNENGNGNEEGSVEEYERVGVAVMEKRHVDVGERGVEVRIV